MKTITVEWRHLDKNGRTCERCGDTGETIGPLIRSLQEECRPKGVEILFTETHLDEAEIDQSNLILINGKPLEALLPLASAGQSNCCSCGEITGKNESCRTIVRNSRVFEAVPGEFIREAICRVAGCC